MKAERMKPYEVYALIDEQGRIVDINSGEFIEDTASWIKIDEGTTERHHHAQRNFLPLPIQQGGVYRYKLVDGQIVERTASEMEADADQMGADEPSQPAAGVDGSRITSLEQQIDMLLKGATSDAQMG